MKLDTTHLRYLTPLDWAVLTAVESGSRNHEIVPTPLIAKLCSSSSSSKRSLLSQGDIARSVSTLARAGLVAKVPNAKYDGYRLTYGGLDYLALHVLSRGSGSGGGKGSGKHGGNLSRDEGPAVYSVGNQIGVGKESDIYVVAAPGSAAAGCVSGNGSEDPHHLHLNLKGNRGEGQRVLKIHRLGRISFRNVKAKRDYGRKRGSGKQGMSGGRGGGNMWMHMSTLAARKEFAFMSALHEMSGQTGVRVPRPIARDRHQIVMELIDGVPMRSVDSVADDKIGELYGELMGMIVRLAGVGLIHGDFNEFNILIVEDETQAGAEVKLLPVLIDFPQMVSVDHPDAEFYFQRDVDCIKRFFQRKFQFVADDHGPYWEDVRSSIGLESRRLDVEVEASGFPRKYAKELEKYMKEQGVDGDHEKAIGDAEGENESEDRSDVSGDEDGSESGGAEVEDNDGAYDAAAPDEEQESVHQAVHGTTPGSHSRAGANDDDDEDKEREKEKNDKTQPDVEEAAQDLEQDSVRNAVEGIQISDKT